MKRLIGILLILGVFGVVFFTTVDSYGIMNALKVWGAAVFLAGIVILGAFLAAQ
ncbi:hypothetical protein LCGC14_1218460 [marine sediment metagenome]|uniref:Uncharacterized protein n=1 Tax=marine sediment metagenome TaxID=412755 RepID=A0A0F9NU74_9ZZZZ